MMLPQQGQICCCLSAFLWVQQLEMTANVLPFIFGFDVTESFRPPTDFKHMERAIAVRVALTIAALPLLVSIRLKI